MSDPTDEKGNDSPGADESSSPLATATPASPAPQETAGETPATPEAEEPKAADPTAVGIETVTAEELAALADVISEGQPKIPDSPGVADKDAIVLRYDIVGANTGTRRSLPVLELVHDRFRKELENELERATRISGTIEIEQPRASKFAEVFSTLEHPCAALIIDAIGMDARGMIILEPALLLHFLDLFIGGAGGSQSHAMEMVGMRGYSPAEKSICAHFSEVVGKSTKEAWRDVTDVSIELVRVESDPRHAVILEPGDPVMEFPVKVDWAGVTGTIRLVLPLSAIRPLEARLSSTIDDPSRDESNPWEPALMAHIRNTPVDVIVELGRANVTLQRLLELNVGDVVRLDRAPEGELNVEVSGRIKYTSRPVIQRGNLAAQISEVLNQSPHKKPIDSTSNSD
jgi:flagellar motor switch protein FliM